MNMNHPTTSPTSAPADWEKLAPAPLSERQFDRFLGAMQDASRQALPPSEEAAMEETLLSVEPAPLGIGRAGRLNRAMEAAAPRRRARSYAAWYGRAAACAAALALLWGGAVLFDGIPGASYHPVEALGQVNRQILESNEGSVHWDDKRGVAYQTYNVLYQDSFYLDDDATGAVVISVPNRCRVEVPEEII